MFSLPFVPTKDSTKNSSQGANFKVRGEYYDHAKSFFRA